MKKVFHTYLESYRGLSQPTWMLAIVMLINRTGAMVLPFLGIYMTSVLGFTLEQAGLVLSCFGAGAVLGSVAGGWLTDKFGHFKIQTVGLVGSVPVFLILPFLTSVTSLAIGVFSLSCITDIFRPANSVSISRYARPENITRAFSLNRMALNLGFSIGPALGGFFAAISFHLLFYGNAFSAAVAGVVFYFYFHKKEIERKNNQLIKSDNAEKPKGRSPWLDRHFVIFSILCCLYSVCFFQLLSTLPLYYKDVAKLSSWDIGFLLAFNGVVVFALEMLIVSISEKYLTTSRIIVTGLVICGLSFLVLLLGISLGILYLSMFLLSVSEILAMPFMATVAIRRSTHGKEGAYMGLNSLSFSAAHILSPILGTAVAARFGYDSLWEITAVLSIITAGGIAWNLSRMERGRSRKLIPVAEEVNDFN